MQPFLKPFLDAYNTFFQLVGKVRLAKQDLPTRTLHSFLMVWIGTVFLMWSHAILAPFTVGSPVLITTGFVCCLIYSLSPFCYRFTNDAQLVSDLMLFSGTIYITTFSYYTGGFLSHNVLWLPACPMLAGVMGGMRGAFKWGLIILGIILGFLGLTALNYPFPYLITRTGLLWVHGFLVFGWICMGSILSIYFFISREKHEAKLKEQGEKIDELFRVLFHDLANSLGRIGIGLSISRRQENAPATKRGIEIAVEAADSMLEITQNVRKLYAATKGKTDVDLEPTSLCSAIEYVEKIFQDDLEKKRLQLKFDHDRHRGLMLLVEPVSFKNQVLANIISNAIKFSHEAKHIHIQAYALKAQQYVVEIRDEGMGMPESLLRHLFDLNKKTSRPGTCGEPGTGFGMHIMKSFMEIYQGEVKVESEENGGTTFKLILKGEWV